MSVWNSLPAPVPFLYVVNTNAAYVMDVLNCAVLVTTGATAGMVITLPPVGTGGTELGCKGAMVFIKKVDAGVGTVSIVPFAPAWVTIEGAASYGLLVQYSGVLLMFGDDTWLKVSVI